MTDAKLIITRADLDPSGLYVGGADVSDWRGDIDIAADLGWVRFPETLRASRSIRALAGSGIEAGWGIKAGEGIEAGSGIEAGRGIEAGFSIVAQWIASKMRIFAGTCPWRLPAAEEMQVRAELREGVIAFGAHVAPETTAETETQP